jgi:DNA (cytosine-5)-methyltransferase 1
MALQSTFIDLFSGCGGLSLGLMQAGWRGLFAIEKNADAFRTLRHNLLDVEDHNKHQPKFGWPEWLSRQPHDICELAQLHGDKLKALRGTVQLVAGGPPCQGFSFAGRRTGRDPRNELFREYLKVVDMVQPQLVLMENVHGIAIPFTVTGRGHKARTTSYADRIKEGLEALGYTVEQSLIRACDFGVPQYRPRFFTFGIRSDRNSSNNPPSVVALVSGMRESFLRSHGLDTDRPVTVEDAICDLQTSLSKLVECQDPDSRSGFRESAYAGPHTAYQFLMHGKINGRHLNSMRLANHRPETTRRFSVILKTCRKGVMLSDADRRRLGIRKISTTPLAPDRPSHTITTLPDDLLHYAEPRIHTVREYARLQSFPDWFEFCGKYTTGGARRREECPRYTQVGNAVPPLLAKAVGTALLALKATEPPTHAIPQLASGMRAPSRCQPVTSWERMR